VVAGTPVPPVPSPGEYFFDMMISHEANTERRVELQEVRQSPTLSHSLSVAVR
jgi:hypothetical protein